ncbi:putative mutator protein MutT4 [Mycobacteroides salmoniphilum]|uniref:Putative mutator protein MutT4 n=1 Tax=Mycobacteroides salmoniphilum TaxID=404941 RepID=A0A4R8S7U2_9MYCO|nr:NUDIX hydrolase [Mycobacteroides salmoniphilum]TDZ76833.1 putative mutator protein MutT4 [Mycobacteroides salmoniphilum]TDZ82757.1 putative mutator protein MutT4 [Mycobacteroides salmoniphilum]TDZ86993.1 putative mutator protein MutT4 [Mycobacteroides salmoniphilum]
MPDPTTRTGTAVLAAGAALWRYKDDTAGAIEVALVHRPRYDDWSLPKGKLDPGETPAIAAVREIAEETGFTARLGRRLPSVSYPVTQGTKRVRYWAAQALDGKFEANHEVDEIQWLPITRAIKTVSYAVDRKVLRNFAKHEIDTRTLIIVRHGKAGRKERYSGDDTLRPLDKKGRAQAEALTSQLLAFGASAIHAADRLRCRQTVEPLAEELNTVIYSEPALSEEAYWADRKRAHRRILEIAGSDGVQVVCTQGRVIPDLIDWWADRDGVRPDKSRNRKGSMWVLSIHGQKLLAADHLASPLPAGS